MDTSEKRGWAADGFQDSASINRTREVIIPMHKLYALLTHMYHFLYLPSLPQCGDFIEHEEKTNITFGLAVVVKLLRNSVTGVIHTTLI